ncbi:MAG: hypothetical protein RJB01_170 [Actinomycetota bacterium]|jgi:hypothetical protein
MDEKTKQELDDGAKAAGRGLADIADVAGHIIAGGVKGAADGVEAVSHANKEEQEHE